MGLSKEAAYKILKLHAGDSEQKVIKHFKALSLENYPTEEHISKESFKVFRDLCQAACVVLDVKHQEDFQLKEMLSLFQLLFFKENESTDEEDGSDSYEEESEDCDADVVVDAVVDDSISQKSNKFDSEDDENKEEKEAVKIAKELIQEEERAKKKAEKKKTQKKKRKERKKAEKEAVKKVTEKPVHKKEVEPENEPKRQVIKEESKKPVVVAAISSSSEDSEEDIDTNSAFVAVIARKKNRLKPVNSKTENKFTTNLKKDPFPKEDPASRVLRSRQLALRGNQMANNSHYNEAIELFTEAIKLEPNDHRFYGNRSYCFDRIGNFERALRDANKSISIVPDWPKGHFRKGRALSSLKKYTEADACFKEVLRLDPECDDAVKEQFNLRIIQLMEMGFLKSQAEEALEEHGNVDRALESLLAKCRPTARNDTEIFFSDDDDEEVMQYTSTVYHNSAAQAVDVKMDPNNPEGHNSIWVGNIQPDVTESMLQSLFSKYGELLSVKVMSEKYCAFVNFRHPKSAGMAMRALQGLEVCNKEILIRFPNVNPKSASGAKSAASPTTLKASREKVVMPGDECYFWRTTGCIRGTMCKYKHISKNRGIDQDKVYLKS